MVILSNRNLELGFDETTGAMILIRSLADGWTLLDRPQLGLSFRLLCPMQDRRNNKVYGGERRPDRFELSEDRRRLVIAWDQVVSEHAGVLEIGVETEVRVFDEHITFSIQIDNRSCLTVENVDYPYFGDLRHPEGDSWLKGFISQYSSNDIWDIWPQYSNRRGYYGVDFPTQYGSSMACGAPSAPYILIGSEKRGIYVGVDRPESELVAWHTELHPGYENSMSALCPAEDSIGGKDVFTQFSAVHVPYILSGENRTLTSVRVSAYSGGWQEGMDRYKEWAKENSPSAGIPDWVKEPHSWQQIHINSPEDELRVSFRNLPEIGRECAAHGVRAIQLVGWNDGGQDQNNPSHSPDPRLGTFEELKEAIRQIQEMGVKVVLFTKFVWADRGTENFKKIYKKMAVKDPYGDYYVHPGYMYQTASQLLDISTKRLVPMCFLDEAYQKVCREEFQKILDLGADGMLFDECLHHTPSLLCFDTSHGHRPGAPVYSWDRELIRMFQGMLTEKNRDFLFAGEALYDWEFEVYQLSYFRSENTKHVPVSRYMRPDMPHMTAVTGFNDRNMINQCLMYRYIISYEPYNFKGRLKDYPLTLAYGEKMDRLRTELREYFWDGEFMGTGGASVSDTCAADGASAVTAAGAAHDPFAVYRTADGRLGLVICNYGTEKITVRVKMDTENELSKYCSVDEQKWVTFQGTAEILPYSAVVLI